MSSYYHNFYMLNKYNSFGVYIFIAFLIYKRILYLLLIIVCKLYLGAMILGPIFVHDLPNLLK